MEATPTQAAANPALDEAALAHEPEHMGSPQKPETLEQDLEAHASHIYPFLIIFLAALLALWGRIDMDIVVSFLGDAVLIAGIVGCLFMMSKSVGWRR